MRPDEEYLDDKFPKGDKQRGEAMILLVLARIEGKKTTKEIEVLLRKAFEHGKNNMWERHFNDWINTELKLKGKVEE